MDSSFMMHTRFDPAPRFEDPNPLNAPDSEESPVPLPPDDPDQQLPLDEPSKKLPTKPL